MLDERRSTRQRVYSLVALLLATMMMVIALGGFLHVGSQQIDQAIYTKPHLTLEALGKAEARYFRKDLDGNGVQDFAPSLEALHEAGSITQRLATGEVGGYRYEVLHADRLTWSMRASPVEVTSQTLFFYVDQTSVIRAKVGTPADKASDVFYDPFQGVVWLGGGDLDFLHKRTEPSE